MAHYCHCEDHTFFSYILAGLANILVNERKKSGAYPLTLHSDSFVLINKILQLVGLKGMVDGAGQVIFVDIGRKDGNRLVSIGAREREGKG